MYWERDWSYVPKAAPRPAPKPGKARKKFGTTWWGEKWVGILSEYEYDQRMSRGRAYARADKVSNFKIAPGKSSASVQGSSKYKVSINFEKYSSKDWMSILEKLRNTPILLSKLLNNEMPEELKKSSGYSFIPDSFKAECSCPDYANPCKHIATIFYVLSEEIDNAPQILFKLQGLDNIEILNFLNNNIKRPKKKNG